ncbi:DENN domain-containing protein 5B isoform X2 [Neocloeon triangulifer]|uniref:DENN domain-containing protein 5B isoform X2 n=1 Tax=Neocloeon triangulifer TaxID=2078957 RepID=UPI00286F992B|nr:DENN domain-containing protein 5B isoform X2 [Neocloeon triangulifer]
MGSQATLNSQVRFADYFVICGLDLNSGLELNVISGESQQLCSPIERSYKCKVLAHYPDNVSWNPFDKHAVCLLSLPHGLKFRTQKQNLEPEFHSFIITKEDGSRCYGFSLVFFEEVSDRKLCSAMQTLQAMHLTELSSSRHSGRMKAFNSDNTRSLPRHFKLSTPLSKAAQSYYDSAKDTLYASKTINLICQLPFVHAANKFLSGLYQYSVTGGELSLESYVYNLVHQVPLPLPGRCLTFDCFEELILLQRPGNIAELPFFDFSLRAFFELLGVDVAIQLFTCLLLEHQVLLYSSVYQRLMLVAECSSTLLFPFSWPHVYVPILPASLHHFLDAPVPFVMGLHQSTSTVPYSTVDNNQAMCHVDIDNKRIQLPEELPHFPQRSEFISEVIEVMQRYGVEPDKCRTAGDRRGGGLRRKLSWSQESESGLVCVENAFMSSSLTGFLPSPSAGVMGMSRSDSESNSLMVLDCQGSPQEQYAAELRFNNAIREVFLNRFVHIFSAYEHFVIHPNQDMEQWLNCRESMQNFDKATFLSDQPEQQLPFLSRFIETQMFATLIDQKILSAWQPVEPSLRVFDKRIKLIRTKYGDSLVRTPCYEPCTTITDSELMLEKRLSGADTMAPIPIEICSNASKIVPGLFPILNKEALNKEPAHRRRSSGQWRERSIHSAETTPTSEVAPSFAEPQPPQNQAPVLNKHTKQPKFTEMSPAVIAQTNWSFVEKLLKDCKLKTKRMLVEKMGSEAVELGHAEPSIMGVEENTLVASLCDLLERVWSHGLHKKQGKSALWSHLLNFQELEECSDTSKPISPNFLTPALAWCVLRKRLDYLSSMALEREEPTSGGSRSGRSSARSSRSNSRRQSPERRDRSIHEATLRPLPVSLTFDMRNVLAMTDIKTHIGYARAWVRLALEKKLLSKHLRTLLMDNSLLKTLYKRYAFLRCDDEKEQFLYHLLTLNAVDYYCYTNTYTTTKLPYRIVIFPSRKSPLTTANIWVSVTGTLGETSQIAVPHGFLEFVFHHKNLGLLTSMRVGHDNYGASPKFLIEHIVARNEVTGHTFKFPCGKWLGRGMDDGSIERLLVGEMVPRHVDSDELIESCMTPPRCRSPSIPRRSVDPKLSTSEMQQMLGETVNTIVKHFLRPRRSQDKGGLTQILCGEGGLVPCLEQTFLLGFRSARLFGRNLYLWDFFARVRDQFEISLVDESNSSCLEEEQEAASAVMRLYCRLVEGIETQGENLGKEGKLQLLICLAARDHLLHRMIPHIAATRACSEMFDENSFLRDASLCTFLTQILESLDEFDFILENSLTKGLQL